MEMARASQEDIERVIEFFQLIEEFMEYGTATPNGSDSEAEPRELADEEFVELLRSKWGNRFGPALVDASWMRVVFGYGVLVDNCCDKEKDVLDLRADWKAILEQDESTSTSVDSKPKVGDLAMLVARLVHQVRIHDANNDVAAKAMDYLRRKDLAGSVLREMKGGA